MPYNDMSTATISDLLPDDKNANAGNHRRAVFIYALCDPITSAVRYIGKAVDPKARYYVHTSRHSGPDTYSKRWIAKLRRDGLKPVLRIIEETTEAEWRDRERFWIAHYTAENAALTNMSGGGDGFQDLPEEVELGRRRKVSASRMGMRFSEEHKKSLSEAKHRQFANPKAREVLSRHWAVLSDEQVREVYALGLEGKYTQYAIAEKYNIPQSSVSEIMTGKRYQHALVGIWKPGVKHDKRRKANHID